MNLNVLILFCLTVTILPRSHSRGIPNVSAREPAAPVAYLAINALAFTDDNGQIVKRRLELNWFNDDPATHKIVLYDADPSFDPEAKELIVLDAAYHKDGFYVTDIQLEKPTSEELGYQPRCVFPFWIRIEDKVTGKGVTEPRCLQMEPSWMHDRRESIGHLQLSDLSLTETHDAAAYKDYIGPEDDNLVTLSVYAQEESLLQQLQWGVRSLDIRIGYYPTLEEKFWLVHGIIKTYPLSEGLKQIQEFLKNSQDIIIWQTNGFEQNWDEEAHRDLKIILHDSFSKWWVRPLTKNWDATLEDVWSREELPPNEGRIILTYGESGFDDPSWFFPDRHYTWGNVNDPKDLKVYLDSVVADAFQNDYGLWVAGCQMTPTADDIIFGKWHGLRDMADRVNRNVTQWWLTEYSSMNRVGTAHDFILSTDAIHTGIQKSLSVAMGFDPRVVVPQVSLPPWKHYFNKRVD